MVTRVKPVMRWVRISMQRAKERWAEGKSIIMVPCKCSPGSIFDQITVVFPDSWMHRAEEHGPLSLLWAGSVEKTAWNLMYNLWQSRSASYTMGYYAHYYIAKPLKEKEHVCNC